MFFVLSKIIGFFLNPFSVFWLMVLIAIIFWKKRWVQKWKWIPVAFFFLFSNSFIALEYARMWEHKGRSIDSLDENYEVGVVLSGMAEYNNDLDRLSIRRGSDRIWWAMQLYKKGKINKILISGKSGYVFNNGLKESEQFKENLINLGIPAEDIITENQSVNTYENAKFSAEIINEMNFGSVLLITSGLHMKRSIACFQKQGVDVDHFSTDHYTGISRSYKLDQIFLPSLEAFTLWDRILHEQFGYFSYWIMGYL